MYCLPTCPFIWTRPITRQQKWRNPRFDTASGKSSLAGTKVGSTRISTKIPSSVLKFYSHTHKLKYNKSRENLAFVLLALTIKNRGLVWGCSSIPVLRYFKFKTFKCMDSIIFLRVGLSHSCFQMGWQKHNPKKFLYGVQKQKPFCHWQAGWSMSSLPTQAGKGGVGRITNLWL